MNASNRDPLPYGGRLMFTQSWEDPECDLLALRPRRGDHWFAITSGGDNVLGFLLTDPARITSVDLNPTQTWLLELKMAAFRHFTHPEMLQFLGVRSPTTARDLYPRLRGDLSAAARRYWDGQGSRLDRGLLVSGGFERYFAMLRAALRVVIGRRRLEQLFTLDPGSQREYFEREWNTPGWRMLVRLGCSRWMLGNRLDPSWFEHGDGPSSFGRHFTALAAHAIGQLPARTNYFLAGMLLGRYLDEVEVPDYLRPGNFETIRQRLERLQPVTADVGEALSALPARSVDCFALSNVFEYGPVELFARAMREVARVARPGARLSLRNLLAARLVSDDMAFAVDGSLSERLRGADRGFIYSRFQSATLRGT